MGEQSFAVRLGKAVVRGELRSRGWYFDLKALSWLKDASFEEMGRVTHRAMVVGPSTDISRVPPCLVYIHASVIYSSTATAT